MAHQRKKGRLTNRDQQDDTLGESDNGIHGEHFSALGPDGYAGFEKSSGWNMLPKFFLVATVVSLLIIAGIIFSLFLPALADQNFATDLVFGLSVGVSSLLILVAVVKFFATLKDKNGWNQYIEEDIESNGWKTKLLMWGGVALAVLCIAGVIIFSAGISFFPMPAVSSIIGNMSRDWIDSALALLFFGAISSAYVARSTYKECVLCQQARSNSEHRPILTSTEVRSDTADYTADPDDLDAPPEMVSIIGASSVPTDNASRSENKM